jgi:DNA polymerase
MSDTLQLDKRQRAMLAEMGVRVWTPVQEHAPLRETYENLVVAKIAQTANNLDWPSLREAVVNCQACGLCTSRRNTVFGTGSHTSNSDANNDIQPVDWLIVGEAPGENEDAVGEPFLGQAGQLLDNMLRAMQLSRTGELSSASKSQQSIFITNVLKCRPPGNRNPALEEVAQCMPYLQRQIALLQPKIIFAMGRFAAQALLRDSIDQIDAIPLGKLRGQVHRLGNTPVVVTYHPAYVLRNLPEKAKLWADACLAMATLNQP